MTDSFCGTVTVFPGFQAELVEMESCDIPEEVEVGESVTVAATFTNGNERHDADVTVTLLANGDEVEPVSDTIPSEGSIEVEVTFEAVEADVPELEVGWDLSATEA